TSYSDKQLAVMLCVSKRLFSMHPTHGNTRWSHWVRRRARLVACYAILYPAALVPAALVLRQPLIAPQTLEQIKDHFAEDWHRCQEYARQHNAAWASLSVD